MEGSANFHLCAFFKNQAIAATNVALTVVQDQILTPLAPGFVVPKTASFLASYGAGVGLKNMRVNCPSFRYVGLPYQSGINLTTAVPSMPNFNLWDGKNLQFVPVDSFSVETTNTDAGAQDHHAGLWLGFGKRIVVPNPDYRLHFTGTITGANGVWANGAIVPDQTLPAGRYQIIGMDCVGTALLFARLIIPGATFRPGCVGRPTQGIVPRPEFTDGTLGVYGEFDAISIPNLEIYCTAACTAQDLFLDLVRIG